ncbi:MULTISPECIES: ACP S-malonyltransferase [Rhodomicrobium]|uniref:ACP S-malonyltransferase n=1 Tax=Rhodomicrobium TaxID=1068 RepID=UPI000B4AFE56|nr:MULTISPECIES: ACP S-malonyltransferase [Rhodomicrobium]
MDIAFTFPGQGSQFVGMGKDLAAAYPAARAVFAEIDDALGEKLTQIIWDGPAERLTLTENAQPALMAVSLAVLRVLEAEKGWDIKAARYVAGHSLGEYSALAAAGTLSISDAARLLRIRGKAMQVAVPVGEGAMAALLGVDLEVAAKIAAEASDATGLVCQVANDNAPGQVVISGAKGAVEIAGEIGKDYGLRRAIALPVSAPFHCALMQPAADRMAEALSEVTLNPPAVPLIANVTAAPVSDPETIRRLLVQQVTDTVRWRESVAFIADEGVTTLYEIGAGKVLSGMARRIDERLTGKAIGTADDVEAVAASAVAAQ